MDYPVENGWSIRKCRADDARAVIELWRQAGATSSVTDTIEDVRRVAGERSASVLVAEEGGQLIGSIIGTYDGWRGHIYRVAVHPNYRRRGVARSLVAAVDEWLAQQQAKRITALVEKDHPWAVAFWQAVGYELDPRMVRYGKFLPRPV